MPYRSLYRRQRPATFTDMVGQEHVSRTLSHALSRGQLAHAYLFCGPRGTGKTTAAKILARALNCDRYPAPEPCGDCPHCREIAAGASLDVLEMDAASNRGIDEIRELRERTRYASGGGRYKVYIIDEVHMLTTEAFNAFLKTLEDPPAGVIFILATTDPGKLPATIVSRCQRFNFNLLTVEEIFSRLLRVAEQEGWQAEEEALRLVARLAEGSMRDALGLLEQAQAYGGEKITAEHVRTVTGATRVETIAALVEAVAAEDLSAGLTVLREVLYSGRDLQLFLRDLAYLFSRLLLGPTGGAGEVEPGFRELVQRFAGHFERRPLLEAAELLHRAGAELRLSHLPQVTLEMVLLQLLRVLHEVPPAGAGAAESHRPGQSTPARIRPEARRPAVPAGAGRLPAEPAARSPGTPPQGHPSRPGIPAAGSAPETFVAAPKAAPDKDDAVLLDELRQSWPKLAEQVRRRKKSAGDYMAVAAPAEVRGNLVLLHFKARDYTGAIRIMEESNRLLAEEILSRFCRRPVRLKVVHHPDGLADSPDGGIPAGSGKLPPGPDRGSIREPARARRHTGTGKERPSTPAAPPESRKGILGDALQLFPGKLIDAGDEEE